MKHPSFFFTPFSILIFLAGISVVFSTTASSSSLPLQVLSLKSSLKDPLNTFHDWEDPNPGFSKPGLAPVWCSWSGVKCDRKNYQITGLDLSKRNLSGEVPADIRYLVRLHHLNLSENAFEGPLPPALFELPNLRSLGVNHNNFGVLQQFLEAGEHVVMISMVKKIQKLTNKKVQLILTNKPKLIYVDPAKLVVKGDIIWSDNPHDLSVQVVSPSHFKICTSKKVLSFEDSKPRALQWKKAIEALQNR